MPNCSGEEALCIYFSLASLLHFDFKMSYTGEVRVNATNMALLCLTVIARNFLQKKKVYSLWRVLCYHTFYSVLKVVGRIRVLFSAIIIALE